MIKVCNSFINQMSFYSQGLNSANHNFHLTNLIDPKKFNDLVNLKTHYLTASNKWVNYCAKESKLNYEINSANKRLIYFNS